MLVKPPTRRAVGRRPGAILTAELILILPVLLFLLYSLICICELLTAHQALACASREGARTASIGGDSEAIEAAVHRTLAACGPLVHADVDVRYVDCNDGESLGTRRIAIVTTSAPAGVALIGLPASFQSFLTNEKIIGIAIMRVE